MKLKAIQVNKGTYEYIEICIGPRLFPREKTLNGRQYTNLDNNIIHDHGAFREVA